jgi:hypothetical protein
MSVANFSEPFWATQELVECQSQEEAENYVSWPMSQVGFICARIIAPQGPGWWDTWALAISDARPKDVWKVQALHEDCGSEAAAAGLPDGLRRVLVLPCMKTLFSIVPKGNE